MLPGGALLLPIAAKILPFDLFPSAFCKSRESGAHKEEPPAYRLLHFYDACCLSADDGDAAPRGLHVSASSASSRVEPSLWQYYSSSSSSSVARGPRTTDCGPEPEPEPEPEPVHAAAAAAAAAAEVIIEEGVPPRLT
jgi:hypothetical protein